MSDTDHEADDLSEVLRKLHLADNADRLVLPWSRRPGYPELVARERHF